MRYETQTRILLMVIGLSRLANGQCPPGSFGLSCQFLCHCASQGSCDAATGACSEGCAADYGGPVCQARLVHLQASIHNLPHSSQAGVDAFVIKLEEEVPLNRIFFVGDLSHLEDTALDIRSVFNVSVAEASCFVTTMTRTRSIVIYVDCRTTGKAIEIRVPEKLSLFLQTSQFSVLVCSENFYGTFCDTACDFCENGTVCDHVAGRCPQGCSAGYQGEKCNSACSNSTFGHNCSSSCGMCLGRESCDHVTGTCAEGCADGWKGDKCTETCIRGAYGQKWAFTCGSCKDGLSCDPITGTCAQGCAEGWEGERCDRPCDKGSFEKNCSQLCKACDDGETCNYITGLCQLNHTTSTARNPVPVLEKNTPNVFYFLKLVGITVGAAAVLAVVVSVTVMMWKRRTSRTVTFDQCPSSGRGPGHCDFTSRVFDRSEDANLMPFE